MNRTAFLLFFALLTGTIRVIRQPATHKLHDVSLIYGKNIFALTEFSLFNSQGMLLFGTGYRF